MIHENQLTSGNNISCSGDILMDRQAKWRQSRNQSHRADIIPSAHKRAAQVELSVTKVSCEWQSWPILAQMVMSMSLTILESSTMTVFTVPSNMRIFRGLCFFLYSRVSWQTEQTSQELCVTTCQHAWLIPQLRLAISNPLNKPELILTFAAVNSSNLKNASSSVTIWYFSWHGHLLMSVWHFCIHYIVHCAEVEGQV